MEQFFETEESRTINMEGYALLSLKNTNGNLVVEGCEEAILTLHTVKKVKAYSDEEAQEALSAIRVVVSEERPALRVVTDASELKPKREYSVDYRVQMPKRMAVSAETANGNVTTSNTGAETTVRSQNGNVRASRIEGKAAGRTTNGSVRLEDVNGPADGRTANGNVELLNIAGPVSGATTNGNVRASATQWGPGYEARLHSVNGNVELQAPEGVSAQVTASVQNGRVRCDLPARAGVQTRTRLEGTLGSGEGIIDLRTTNGNARIHRGA
jgi:DUF4097 and DUF4098 domain-containing protein YvlB